ncbi:MAG TPA: hemerythrin family protein [Candidatus Limivivens merdigallinarum]|uniref:Hemerythrin family protein n=1 Tax=Candidatus Limivivens merdigallinarum TaxID=2840859 RepID=A0A9D0ZYL6_9FIRM|nr:hemerythrin family protein [Candidatus Limivivens merdigallinarum]
MVYATLDDSLITGNELIDGQHEELIERINQLLKSCETSTGQTTAIKMLDYLSEYTDFHFKAEEKLQEEIGYPEIEAHKKQHEAFKKAVEELHEMLVEEEGPSEAFVEQVQKNVVEWLYKHIGGFDRSVAEYVHIREN